MMAGLSGSSLIFPTPSRVATVQDVHIDLVPENIKFIPFLKGPWRVHVYTRVQASCTWIVDNMKVTSLNHSARCLVANIVKQTLTLS